MIVEKWLRCEQRGGEKALGFPIGYTITACFGVNVEGRLQQLETPSSSDGNSYMESSRGLGQ